MKLSKYELVLPSFSWFLSTKYILNLIKTRNEILVEKRGEFSFLFVERVEPEKTREIGKIIIRHEEK